MLAALAGDVSRFRETAGALLAGAIEALGELASSPVEYAETSLADDSLIGLILATHAPPDAVVLSARVVLRLADRRIEGFLYLLLDAKPLEALVGRLDSSPARSSAPPSC